jgi:hypothetical protein
MHSYGITVDKTQLALVILANVELTSCEDWEHEFCPALQTIHHAYAYNYAHDSTSISTILRKLAGADAMHKLNEAPPPHSQGSSSAITDQVAYRG